MERLRIAAVPSAKGTTWLVFIEIPDPWARQSVLSQLGPRLVTQERLLGHDIQALKSDPRWLPWTERNEPLRFLEPRETETRKMHALEEYGLMHVKLYEDIARHGQIATAYAYPVKVEGRYVMDPSPIPKFDNPKMSGCGAIQLFGAGREQRIYALPPWTQVVSLDFEDFPFEASKADAACDLCGAEDSYLDEVITDDAGGRIFVCSDTDYCRSHREAGFVGAQGEEQVA